MAKKRPISRKDWAADELRENFTVPEDEWPRQSESAFAARVVEVHKGFAFVSPEKKLHTIDLHDVWLGTIPKRFLLAKKSNRKLLAVGDRVWCEPDAHAQQDLPHCRIVRNAPRRNVLARLDPFNKALSHVIASNIDHLIITSAYVSPPLDFTLIDRYLVFAAQQNITPLLVFNKEDLLDDEQRKAYVPRLENYRRLGYQVLSVQATTADFHTQDDLVTLQKTLAQGIAVFSGNSGVGKSSLVNLFSPSLPQAVADELTRSGQHTTTYASLLSLQTGGYVIDTPGIKKFPLAAIAPAQLGGFFVEFAAYSNACRYRSCLHDQEPVCGVREAVKAGNICPARYASYLTLLATSYPQASKPRA